jgi:Tol biopolymer transport system component
MNIDGSNLRQVATSDLWESGVAWSPDSRWLVLAHGESQLARN